VKEKSEDTAVFGRQLVGYKQAIDEDIARYAAHVRAVTLEQYGEYPATVTNAYLDMLERGGKRIRGALVVTGYLMCGGKDMEMITRAATALEMLHSYMLIIDDIQDRSALRRGKPTVHEGLAAFHRERGLQGDADHTGIALALNAALTGSHAAQVLLAGLSAPEDLRLKAIGIINQTLLTTAHGQTADIMNEIDPDVTQEDVERALELKTAHYTILNPLCVGMVLAGAGCEDTDAIRDYSLHTGKVFQITDDIIGIFGDDAQTGKTAKDDIREGKRTILSVYAIKHADADDRAFLLQCLGNRDLTDEQFERCRQIMRDSGAVDNAKRLADENARQALVSLEKYQQRWTAEQVSFLRGLVQGLLDRSA